MLAILQDQVNVEEEEPSPPNPSENAATQDSVQIEILKILRAMKQDMKRNTTNKDEDKGG